MVQGLGGALMVPVGRLVVLRGVRPDQVLRAVGYLTWPALVAPLFGPFLGGALTTYASWRWIFIVNVPLGIAALCLCRLVPREGGPRRRLDLTGLVPGLLYMVGLFSDRKPVGVPPAGLGSALGLPSMRSRLAIIPPSTR